jgi:hypothetical protein
MDTCLGTAGPAPALPVAILLNIITCAVCVAMSALAAWHERADPPPSPRPASSRGSPRHGLACAGLVQYLSVMALALSLPVLLVFYLAPPGSELACQVAVLNNVGPVPWGTLTAAAPLVMLAFDVSRAVCTRHALAARMARAVVEALDDPAAPPPRRPPPDPLSVLILPAGGSRGLFIAPLLRELRAALRRAHSAGHDVEGAAAPAAGRSVDSSCVHAVIADAWGTAWQRHSSARVLHNLRCEGEGACVAAAETDFFGPGAVPTAPAPLDAILIPYSKHLAAVASGDGAADRAVRLLCLLRRCAAGLRPGGVLAAGVLQGAEARIWAAAAIAAGFVDVTVHPGNVWLSPSPVVILSARVPGAAASGAPEGAGHGAAHLPPLPAPLPLPAARPWFPAGAQWRARDAAVAMTWAPVAVLTYASAAWLPDLLTPTFVTWGSTVGTLALSSALFGPSCAFYTAIELTKFAAGEAHPSVYEKARRRRPRGVGLKASGPDDGAEGVSSRDGPASEERRRAGPASEERLLAAAEDEPPAAHPTPTARDVWSRWLTFELPIFAANIGGFQVVFWLPAFASDAAVLAADGRASVAEADSASTGLGYGLLAVLIVAGWVWMARRARADEATAMEVVRGAAARAAADVGGAAAAGP